MRSVIIPVLLGICCSGGASKFRSLDVQWTLSAESLLTFDRNLVNGDTFLYVSCEDAKSSTDVYCNVTAETMPPADDSAPTKVCSLKFTRRRKVAWMSSVILEHLGPSKAILEWVERAAESDELYTRIAIVDLANCSAVPLDFSYDFNTDFLFSNVVVFGDGFDVIISDEARCGSAKCRISFDAEGRQTGEPAAFSTSLNYVISEAASADAASGFFVFGSDYEELMPVAHVSAAGKETGLASIPKTSHFMTSNSNGRFGICAVSAARLTHCVQYDSAATRMRMNLTLQLGPGAVVLGVHNLAEGGMMLLTSDCRQRRSDVLDCENFHVTKVRIDGSRDKPRKIAEHRFSCDVFVSDVEVDASELDGRVCFYLACIREDYAKRGLKVALSFRSACV